MPSDNSDNNNSSTPDNLSSGMMSGTPRDTAYTQPEVTPTSLAGVHEPGTVPHLGHSVTKREMKEIDKDIEEAEEDDDEDEEKEPEVVREVIIKEKHVRGGGCFDFIKDVTCFLFIAIIALIAATVAIFIFKPAFIFEPLKTFINGPYESGSTPKEVSASQIEDAVNLATEGKKGDVTFQISEDEISSLVKQRADGTYDMRAQVEENRLIILTNIAEEGNPLWFVVEFTDKGDSVELSHLGLGRVNTPEFLRTFLKGQLLKIFGSFSEDLKVQTTEELANSLLNKFLDADAVIKDVNFKKDVILVTVTL
jgi:hypothetical protein